MAQELFDIIVRDRGTKQVQRNIEGIGAAARSARGALAFMRAALVVMASVQIIRRFIELADTLTVIRNRLRLLTASTEELNTVQNALFLLSRDTRTSFEGNVELFSRMTRATTALGLSFQDLLNVTRTVALALRISGATSEEARGAIIQFGQGLAAGAIQGQELRSVAEQFPRLADAIGREFGVAGGQLIAFAKANEGIITTDRVMRALQAELGILGDEFNETVPTIEDGFTRLNNALILFLGGLNDSTGAGQAIAQMLLWVADNLDKVALAVTAMIAVFVLNFAIAQLSSLNAMIIAVSVSAIRGAGTMGMAFTALLAPLTLVRSSLVLVGAATVFAFRPFVALVRGAIVILRVLWATILGIRAMLLAIPPVLALIRTYIIAAMLNPMMIVQGLLTVLTAILIGPFVAAWRAILVVANLFKLAILTNPLFLIGAAVVLAIVGAFMLFKEEIDAVLERMGGLAGIFNTVATFAVAAFITLRDTWQNLPAVFQDLAIQAANGLIRIIQGALREIIEFFNRTFGIEIPIPDFGQFENEFAGAADAIVSHMQVVTAEVEAAGGGVAVLQEQFGRLQRVFGQFIAPNLEVDPSILERSPTITGQVTPGELELSAATRARNALESLVSGLSPAIELQVEMARATEILTQARNQGIDVAEQYGITEAEIMRRVERETLGVGNSAVFAAERQDILSDAFQRGVITMSEFLEQMREVRLEQLDDQETLGAGIERFFIRYRESANDAATAMEGLFESAFGSIEDAFANFVTTGEFSFRKLVDTIAAELARIGIRKVLSDAASALSQVVPGLSGLLGGEQGAGEVAAAQIATAHTTGGAAVATSIGTVMATSSTALSSALLATGSAISVNLTTALISGGNAAAAAIRAAMMSGGSSGSGIFSSIASIFGGGGGGGDAASFMSTIGNFIPGFANGGDMTVGGGGGTDNSLVSFKATRGEKVRVRPRGQSFNEGGGDTNINVSIGNFNADGVSREQVKAEISTAFAQNGPIMLQMARKQANADLTRITTRRRI